MTGVEDKVASTAVRNLKPVFHPIAIAHVGIWRVVDGVINDSRAWG